MALVIGEWQADAATLELARGEERSRLEPKAMEALFLLASRAGEVVSREELFATVWPGVVVGDEALTQSIAKLRRALGDNPREPSYIETIAKRGYRLVAPVREAGTPVQAPAPMRARPPIAGIAALLVLAAVLLVYLMQQRASPPPPAAEAADGRRAAQPTVSVLPFESIGDGGEAYLARGIGNDLTTDLARLPGLQVLRPSGLAARGAPSQYVVSGSVQRAGDTLRINVHLAEGYSGRELWSDRFERPYAELFKVQDEILARITAKLPGKLEEAVRERAAHRYTRSIEAYDWFLRGQALFLVRQPLENDAAREPYRKALEIDPKFARAYAGLAMTYAMDSRLQRDADPGPTLARALELAETARQIDPDIPEVHWAIGFVHTQARRHEEALRSLQKAVGLDPSFADAYALMGGVRTYTGDAQAAIPLLRTALRLNPEGGYLYYTILGRAYLFLGDNEQALINLRGASSRNPVDIETRVLLAAALSASGDRAGAQWQAQEVRSIEPAFYTKRWLAAYPLTSDSYRRQLEAWLGAAGEP
jgi:DNA-binding winged helix-turn-helix (wHTH) protein/TolB-like protein/Flp pilus assembly protein TadD